MYSIDNVEWKGLSGILSVNEIDKRGLISLLELSDDDYQYNPRNNELEIYNHRFKLLFEEQFILSESLEFEELLKKYSNKDFSKLACYSESKSCFQVLSTTLEVDRNLFSSILEENNVVTDGITEDRMLIPPSLFEEMKVLDNTQNTKFHEALNYLSELFSLFMISDKSKVKINDENTNFEFVIFCDNKENHIINVSWKEWSYFNNNVFYKCYDWIINRNQEKFKNATLLKVVRQYLGNLKNIESADDITNSLDSILNRIILNETHEYFEQQNKLKDEFISYRKIEMESNHSLLKSLLGLITTIGLAYYGNVIAIENFNFADKNNNLVIIFIFAFIAVLFFAFSYTLNYIERRKYYISLKDIYTEKFVFSEADFNDFLKKPTFFKGNWVYLLILLIFLFIILCLILFYLD